MSTELELVHPKLDHAREVDKVRKYLAIVAAYIGVRFDKTRVESCIAMC